MARLKTFGIYALLIIGFMIMSVILENGLIASMYIPLEGINEGTFTTEDGIQVTIEDARGTRVNGYMRVKVKNTTGEDIDHCYVQMDLYSKQGYKVATEYVEVSDFKAGEEKEFDVAFSGNEISRYEVSIIKDKPDDSNIINILGWEFDATDFFGLDLTKILDGRLLKLLNFNTLKAGALNLWNWFKVTCAAIPIWAWWIAAGIVIWNLPSGYLFFL